MTTMRLAVTWRHPVTGYSQPVGLLDETDGGYRFAYIEHARDVDGFRPFIGFPELDREYRSSTLFPLFAQRVMDPRRPDYERYVNTLDLPADATPVELLARSEGRRMGDTIQVMREPSVTAGGSTSCRFLVHGIRHVLRDDPDATGRLRGVAEGDYLRLVDEPTNPVNPRAILTTDGDGGRLGWVPDVLLDYVRTVRDAGAVAPTVAHVNGPDGPPHFRLLARLDGQVPSGYRPFDGPPWEPIAAADHVGN
jgi:hypothetical protein